MKRQGTDLEKIYSNDVSYDGHILKNIYRTKAK